MATRAASSVRELYFKHKDMSRIVGEPKFDSLHQMLLEVKENLSSVPSTLGGGAHGYVGVILSVPTYAILVPMTPFRTLAHPSTLTVPPGVTQYDITLIKTQHDENMRTFYEYQLVQRATIQQVWEEINSKYVTRPYNRITGQVPTDIRPVMISLFQIYEKYQQII